MSTDYSETNLICIFWGTGVAISQCIWFWYSLVGIRYSNIIISKSTILVKLRVRKNFIRKIFSSIVSNCDKKIEVLFGTRHESSTTTPSSAKVWPSSKNHERTKHNINCRGAKKGVPARWCSGESVRIVVGRPGVHFLSRVIPKDFNKWYPQLPCLALSI